MQIKKRILALLLITSLFTFIWMFELIENYQVSQRFDTIESIAGIVVILSFIGYVIFLAKYKGDRKINVYLTNQKKGDE